MIWIVAILTMVVGSVLALTQTDIKRLLAYSSIAHAGFILTGFLGIRSLSEVAGGSLTGVSAVLFYLTTYGFTTLAAFALVTVVRDGGGEATHLSRWQGLGKESPLVAGPVRLPAARDGRHPADQRVHRQVGGLRGRAVRRRVAGGDRGGADVGRGGVLLRPGDRADVLRRAGR